MMIWPSSGIKLVKGGENIAYFKLRTKGRTARCYTRCCYTPVVAIAGAKLPIMHIGIPMNRSSVSPPIETTRRINCKELVKPDEALNEEKMSMSDLVPLSLLRPFICGLCCGVGKPPQDPDTLALLAIDIADVTEVAGVEAYRKCGFDTTNLKGF
mmetsp:Transcript_20921/g.35280  ORF Transcript_20921/g.35280 Transcript_20921/m.35280 type:complete len:155 (+) Transcript_20921:43-507(+)